MIPVFVSVGRCHEPEQERFVAAVEGLLRDTGFAPRTPGRNQFDAGDPLPLIRRQMQASAGVVVIALARIHIERGAEHGRPLAGVSLATPWLHVEATMAHMLALPTLILRARGVKADGMLEGGAAARVDDMDVSQAPGAHAGFGAAFDLWRGNVLVRRRAG